MHSAKNVLICCTGSVATIQLLSIISDLSSAFQKLSTVLSIKVVLTKAACHFVDVNEVKQKAEVFVDADEWSQWGKRGDPVLHIELGKWADLLLIAPLDANTLAKIANGLCDNLLTCAVRAWDLTKPLLFCPAMNTRMWDHPITQTHITTLKSWGYTEIPCISKTLMCGDTGMGAMAHVPTIVQTVVEVCKNK
ncbi:phosphopantothenoylcysteine decarboxylase [Nilaparvata lugens]|uniref:phosphopantothenoylcysteine decarboxylase n=1 Tax=Nilaparvata lugens TaxID=108931 RepID=UPI000B990BA9|nr:phosphopantothenoylcysteine decarboxylase [Nilaparvata lugens]XP_039292106.1 phosphopantothenoylcysteine decarboxylase [Nilaparvata lugens]XP_039292107.1 phosphopantothenoylcysteine decarboxylase [Nilaparvata lugens]